MTISLGEHCGQCAIGGSTTNLNRLHHCPACNAHPCGVTSCNAEGPNHLRSVEPEQPTYCGGSAESSNNGCRMETQLSHPLGYAHRDMTLSFRSGDERCEKISSTSGLHFSDCEQRW
jgi:hypothetical protein